MMEKQTREHYEESFSRDKNFHTRSEVEQLHESLTGRFLEVGCGARFSYYSPSLEAYGVDITPMMIKVARKSNRNCHLVVADVQNLPFQKRSFDVVAANVLLHHLVATNIPKSRKKMNVALTEMKRSLKPKGTLIINELLVMNELFSWVMYYITMLCARLEINIEYLDIHSKVVTLFFTEKSLRNLASRNGLASMEIWSKPWQYRHFRFGHQKEFFLKPRNRAKDLK